MAIIDTILLLKQGGSHISDPVRVKGMTQMTFTCSFSDQAANADEVEALPCKCPNDLREFWNEVQTARLFEDQEYGQWGLEIFDPKQTAVITDLFRSERPQDYIVGDLVIGKFLGDSDLLMIRCDPTTGDFEGIVIALPLDPRTDWVHVAASFGDFLEKYSESAGDKYWERSSDTKQ